MGLSKETINKIQETADVVEVIGDFVSLKKRGQNYIACCPFHNEKTPSFSVSAVKQIYKCFGCGKAGDVVQFVMDIEGLGYIESLKFLAKKYGIEVEETENSPESQYLQGEKDGLLIVLNFAKNYFQKLLNENPDGQAIGLSYFKERGFNEATIKKFELGYSLDSWDGLITEAKKNNYSLDLLEKAGLIISKDSPEESKDRKNYDRFRGRVIFPIHNVTGKVIAFTARILKADKNQPKYINSPETEVYHKGKILYGIHQAKTAIRQEDNCYLVEGNTDVVSLHQGGIENVVASSGTSLTDEQIKLINRYSTNITVLYDGDAAGIKASIRGVDMILEAGLNVHVVLFPDGDDPDSYVRKVGAQAFKNFIAANKKDFITFKTQLYLKDAANDPLKKAEVIREIVTSISKIPDPIKRAVFFRQCSTVLEIDEQTLISEYNKIHLKAAQQKKNEQAVNPIPEDVETEYAPVEQKESDQIILHEREMLRLMVNYASESIGENLRLVNYLLPEIDDIEFKTPVYKKMIEIIKEEVGKGSDMPASFFIGHSDPEIRKEAIELMSSRHEISANWAKHQIRVPTEKHNLSENAHKAILRFKRTAIKFLMQENTLQLKTITDVDQVTELIKMNMELKNLDKQICLSLGIVIG